MANESGQAHAVLARPDTDVFCTEVPELGDCSGCYADDEEDGGDEGVTVPGGLLLFGRCMSH
jgi:hypothetical protein